MRTRDNYQPTGDGHLILSGLLVNSGSFGKTIRMKSNDFPSVLTAATLMSFINVSGLNCVLVSGFHSDLSNCRRI